MIHGENEFNIPFSIEKLEGRVLNITPTHAVFEFEPGWAGPRSVAMLSFKDPLCRLILATLSPYVKGMLGLHELKALHTNTI